MTYDLPLSQYAPTLFSSDKKRSLCVLPYNSECQAKKLLVPFKWLSQSRMLFHLMGPVINYVYHEPIGLLPDAENAVCE